MSLLLREISEDVTEMRPHALAGSHLYPGFKHAGALESVQAQRILQGGILWRLAPRKLLIVGSGYGEELNEFLGFQRSTDVCGDLSIIDLADVRSELTLQPHVVRLNSKISFRQLDLLQADELDGFGAFDIIQCGFVLHDIAPHEKDRAFENLANAIAPGGHVLVSDIFVESPGDVGEISGIYDRFIHEGEVALREGRLCDHEFQALVGDGIAMGLKRSRKESVRGERDSFEPLGVLLERARRAGLALVDLTPNPLNKHLFVLLFAHGGDRGQLSTRLAGGTDVI